MKKYCYTIVELLVVIGIMAIVIGIAIPGINVMINGNKVERAAKQLSSAIAKARSEAIVTNRKVALLLPAVHSNINYSYVNSSYAIVVLKKGDITDFDETKNADFKWERLPGNTFFTVFKGTFSSGNDFFEQSNLKKENLSGSEFSKKVLVNGSESRFNRILKNKSNAFTVPMLIFNPDGTVSGADNLYFFVCEGLIGSATSTVMPGGVEGEKRPAGAIGFKLNRFTGRVKYYEEI